MKRKALFLDRDGIINADKGYVHRMDQFIFMDGICPFIQRFQSAGFLIFVVTNQAGIGRGLYTEQDFQALTDWMCGQFQHQGITISKVYYCPYHPTHGQGAYRQDACCRKPKPGMLLQAEREFDLDLTSSVLIGDKESDIEAGSRAGVGTTIRLALSETDYQQQSLATYSVRSLEEAVSCFFHM